MDYSTKRDKIFFPRRWWQYHLYFEVDGKSDKVIGDIPAIKGLVDPAFGGFLDAASPSGIITYLVYARFEGFALGGAYLADSGLYVLQGNRASSLLTNIDPARLDSIDGRMPLNGAYLDQRGNLYVLTLDGMLCVIQNGTVVAKADVSQIAVKPAMPGMFSDKDNTYFLVPKLFNKENSLHSYGNDDVSAKYRIDF